MAQQLMLSRVGFETNVGDDGGDFSEDLMASGAYQVMSFGFQ